MLATSKRRAFGYSRARTVAGATNMWKLRNNSSRSGGARTIRGEACGWKHTGGRAKKFLNNYREARRGAARRARLADATIVEG